MVEVLSLNDLFNPVHPELVGRYNVGEELQDPEKFRKPFPTFAIQAVGILWSAVPVPESGSDPILWFRYRSLFYRRWVAAGIPRRKPGS